MRGINTVPDNADLYWQRPPSKDKGSDKAEMIWQSVGSSLTAWETVEETFASLFRVFVESRSIAADRAYGAIASARGRQDALAAAAEVFFEIHAVKDVWREEFVLLTRHFGLASGRRNEIAHGGCVHMLMEEDDFATGVFLVPSGYNTRKTHAFEQGVGDKFSSLRAKYRYTAEDISEITSRFHALQRVVNDWTMNLWVTYPSAKHEQA